MTLTRQEKIKVAREVAHALPKDVIVFGSAVMVVANFVAPSTDAFAFGEVAFFIFVSVVFGMFLGAHEFAVATFENSELAREKLRKYEEHGELRLEEDE
jgi:uncharacterized membrane protein